MNDAGPFNVSAWALRNRSLVGYLALVLALIGAFSYFHLGQSEDPPFSFKVMLVRTLWPGATAHEVADQINDPIEAKLQETGAYEFIRSYARPGESVVIFVAKDALPVGDKADLWYQVRKKIGDIRDTLPEGIHGPYFNDEFGETYGNIYALSGTGFDAAQLKAYAKRVQLELLRLPDVAKVELIGLQDEVIWLELSNTKIANLGVPFQQIAQALNAQNAINASGSIETPSDRIYLRTSGAFDSVESIGQVPIYVGSRRFRLADVADIQRGFNDPPAPEMRFMGKPAIGLGISMVRGGDIIRLGQALEDHAAQLRRHLPVGLSYEQVANQPRAVRASIREFLRSLLEAVVIVLVVSFISLGFRPGAVVALSIPLVLAMTFAAMYCFGIDLHKISLGALILALGLLVDDAIIAVEMMAVKLEQGYDRLQAAAFAYRTTAFPMLTGTLVTAAGFLPIATAASATGEYTRSIFQVVTVALVISWVAAVVFIPYLGYYWLPERSAAQSADGHVSLYQTAFYRRLRRALAWCLDYRRWVLFATVLAFAASMLGFRWIHQQFFPSSTRLELIVDLKLPEGASHAATADAARRFESALTQMPTFSDDVENYVAYVGTGSPRFYLPLDQQLPQASLAQFVILTRSELARERLREALIHLFETGFPDLRARVLRLENGPPVGYPVQFRMVGEDVPTLRRLAAQVRDQMLQDPRLVNVHLDWDEPSKIIRFTVDPERTRLVGLTAQDVARFLQKSLSGSPITMFREGTERIAVLARGTQRERAHFSLIRDLSIPTPGGTSVPLAQLGEIAYGYEEGIVWRRNRLPTITVRADIYDAIQPSEVTAALERQMEPLRRALPEGYQLETGGTVEDALRGQRSVARGMPWLLLVVTTLLMVQLRSFSKVLLVWLTAPLGMVGVTLFLLLFDRPFGFVAMLGTIALSGMIMRNSVILVDQIDQDIRMGLSVQQAAIEATLRRFRPIVLTALAAMLAMIPLSRSVFFGPMATAIMGGLFSATLLTVFFVPALYVSWPTLARAATRTP